MDELTLSKLLTKLFAQFREKYISPIIKNMDAYDDRFKQLSTDIKSFEPFNPSELEEIIHSVKEDVNNIEPYDDSELQEKIKSIRVYDDSELQKRITELEGSFEKEVSTIKEKIDTPIKVQIPTTKHYDGEVTKAGNMVLHENNLYVNLLDANDSVPSDLNKSYKLIIKAPKEPRHKGVYNPDETYEYNDMVMWENSTWIKTHNDKQELPSEGWKLMAKAVRGRKGERGEQGDVTVVKPDVEGVLQDLHDEINVLKATVKGLSNGTAITE